MADVIAAEQPMWDGLQLKLHDGSLAHLLSDMQFHDEHNGLLNQFDGLPTLLEALDAEHQEFDSIIIDYQHLEKFSNMLSKAMDLAAKGGVAITSMEMSKPFKRKNVVNVAVTYNIADGQNVTIVYHNPDSTQSKLAATDTLISWKIMLNNRDVTGAIQPNQGEGIALPILAGVNKNSARFQRTQVKKAEVQQGLTDAQGRLTDKQGTLEALDAEIEGLKLQLDEVVASNPEDQNNKPEPKFSQDDMITLTVSSMGKLHLWMRIWTRLFIWLS
ncbi:defense against restriction DarA-related protein [Acinetobacter sp. ANC 5502]